MLQESPQYVYKVVSKKSLAELKKRIVHSEDQATHLPDMGRTVEATISRLVALGLKAIQNAGECGVTDFEIMEAIREGCPHGETSMNRAFNEVRHFARRLSDTDYGLIR